MRRGYALAQALCLTLFPLCFLLLSNTGLHPGYAGTAAEQIHDVDRVEVHPDLEPLNQE